MLYFARIFSVRSLAGNFLVRPLRRFFLAFLRGALLRAVFRGGFSEVFFAAAFQPRTFVRNSVVRSLTSAFTVEVFAGPFYRALFCGGEFYQLLRGDIFRALF